MALQLSSSCGWINRYVVRPVLAGWLALLVLSPTAHAKIYLTEEAALTALFPKAESFQKQIIDITPALRRRLEGNIRPSTPWEKRYATFVAMSASKPIGYAVILNEIGKTRPITFIVGVTPQGAVRNVEIMTYREPRGGEVRHKRFLRQYRGKRLSNPLQSPQDIINITGATLSVRAINRGIKKALALIEDVYLTPQGNRDAITDDGSRGE